MHAMEKEPSKRWRSAEAFARALEASSEGGASKIPLRDVSTTPHRIATPARRIDSERYATIRNVTVCAGSTSPRSITSNPAPPRGAGLSCFQVRLAFSHRGSFR
jgi:hypothetical protein